MQQRAWDPGGIWSPWRAPRSASTSTASAEGRYAIIGTAFAAALFCAPLALLRRRGLRTRWLLLFPLYAYALGYAAEYVLTAYLGVREPPMSL
jgi:hypothetical protein